MLGGETGCFTETKPARQCATKTTKQSKSRAVTAVNENKRKGTYVINDVQVQLNLSFDRFLQKFSLFK